MNVRKFINMIINSVVYGKITIILIVCCGLVIPLWTTNVTKAQKFQTMQIFNGQIGLHPRESEGHAFSVPSGAKNIHLKGTISASGGAIKTITIRLYDSSQCPPPDSQGRIHFGSCNIMFNHDYSTGDKIDKYIPHGGKFFLYLQDSSPFFNKVVTGNIYVEYAQ
jgi:hypothetical protein